MAIKAKTRERYAGSTGKCPGSGSGRRGEDFPVKNLSEALDFLTGIKNIDPFTTDLNSIFNQS